MKLLSPVCKSLAEAFVDDPFYRAVTVESSADEAKRQLILAHYFDLAIEEAIGIGEVQYAGDDGAAIWHTNEASETDAKAYGKIRKATLERLLGPAGFDNYQRISASMMKNGAEQLANAWYLSILGVRPAARGRGLAHQLLEPTLSRADRLGATCFLETFNPLSLPFYRRLGFSGEVRCFEDVTARPYWILIRNTAP